MKAQSIAAVVVVILAAAGVVGLEVARQKLFLQSHTALVPIFFSVVERPGTWLRVLMSTPTFLGFAFWIFNKWLWRYLPEIISPRPMLAGTWFVDLKPQFDDPNAPPRVSRAYLVIRQTYLTLKMSLLTQTTTSTLLADHVLQEGDCYTIWAVYKCEPKGNTGPDNAAHKGAFSLGPATANAERWEGRYFMDMALMVPSPSTDSQKYPTRGGSLTATDRRRPVFNTYAEADNYFTGVRSTSGRRFHFFRDRT